MKKLLFILLALISLNSWGQSRKLHSLAGNLDSTAVKTWLNLSNIVNISNDTSTLTTHVATQNYVLTNLLYQQTAAPATTDTVTVTVGKRTLYLLLSPDTVLASLKIKLPSTSLIDGQRINISTTQTITSLTIYNGTIAAGNATTLTSGGFAGYIYNSSAAKWYRIN